MVDSTKLRIFISWSGDLSKAVALALKDWLDLLSDLVEPFMSDVDIEAGQRGLNEIEAALKGASYGIIVTTRDNQDRQWLNFEAGAISKALDGLPETRVTPLLVDLEPEGLQGPLVQFQYQTADRDGFLRLVKSVGTAAGLKEDSVAARFDQFWPQLEEKVNAAKSSAGSGAKPARRTTQDLLTEILELSRGIARAVDHKPTESLQTALKRLDNERSRDSANRYVATVIERSGLPVHLWHLDDEMSVTIWMTEDASPMKVRAIRQELEVSGYKVDFSTP